MNTDYIGTGVMPMRHQKNWDSNRFETQVEYLGKLRGVFLPQKLHNLVQGAETY